GQARRPLDPDRFWRPHRSRLLSPDARVLRSRRVVGRRAAGAGGRAAREPHPDQRRLRGKLTLISVGKLREAWVRDGCEEYQKRVRARLPIEVVEVKAAGEIARRLPARAEVWALDERGRELSSAELADELRRRMSSGSAGL